MKNEALKALKAYIEGKEAERSKALADLNEEMEKVNKGIKEHEEEFIEKGSKRLADQITTLKIRKKSIQDILTVLNNAKVISEENKEYKQLVADLKEECNNNAAEAKKQVAVINQSISDHLNAIVSGCDKIRELRNERAIYMAEALRNARKVTGQVKIELFGGGYYMGEISKPVFNKEDISAAYTDPGGVTIEKRDAAERCLREIRKQM